MLVGIADWHRGPASGLGAAAKQVRPNATRADELDATRADEKPSINSSWQRANLAKAVDMACARAALRVAAGWSSPSCRRRTDMVASVESDPAFPLPLLARYFSCAPSCAPPPHFIQQKAWVTALPWDSANGKCVPFSQRQTDSQFRYHSCSCGTSCGNGGQKGNQSALSAWFRLQNENARVSLGNR